MLTIDDLRLTLPAGFEARAPQIARLVTEALGRMDSLSPGSDLHLRVLAVPHVEIHPGATDAQVAASVAEAIHAGLAGARRC